MAAAVSVSGNELVFANGGFQASVFQALLSRLSSLRPADLEPWIPAIIKASGATKTAKRNAAEVLICIDQLFPRNQYAAVAGTLLIARLESLPPNAVKRFMVANKAFRAAFNETQQAALAIALVAEVFPADRFSDEVFSRALLARFP